MSLSPIVIALIGFFALFLLIFLNFPVAFAFALIGFLGIWYMVGLNGALVMVPVHIWSHITKYALTCAPLFVLMGMFAYNSGIGPELYSSALKWWGKATGGLALTTVWANCAFGALTGSSTAAVLAFTPIAYRPMTELGYDKRLSSGTIVASGTMASVIPPSMTFILYGIITQESISRLFIAGIVPGIMELILYSIAIFLVTGLHLQAGPAGPGSTFKEKIVSLKNIWGMLSIFLLVIGGIYLGVFTPTEAAAVGAAGTLIILLIRRGFNIKLLASSLEQTLRTAGMIILIIACSIIFAEFISLAGVTRGLMNFLAASDFNPYITLVASLLVLLITGAIMPATPMILLFTPILYPVFVTQYGFDGIWFGVIIAVMVELALITPPIGINLFAFLSVAKGNIRTLELWQGVIPFVIADIIRITLLIALPAVVLWLPNLMFQF